jgi:prolyl-tRNA synthetase
MDASDKMPGWKFSEYEMKGVPLRLEIGPKDIENNQAVLVRRDNREKIVVSLDELEVKIPEILDDIQKSLLEKARASQVTKTSSAKNMDEFKEQLDKNPGFVKAMWCGDRACEDYIKENTAATSRCMPFEQEHISDSCVCCGKPSKKLVYWGRAY